MVNGTIRSAFEYGGQKCSACSRMYVPDCLWPRVRQGLLDACRDLRVGDVSAAPVLPLLWAGHALAGGGGWCSCSLMVLGGFFFFSPAGGGLQHLLLRRHR